MRTLRWRWKAEWGEKKECRRAADAALGEEGVMERENAALVVEVAGYRKITEWCDRMGWCIM